MAFMLICVCLSAHSGAFAGPVSLVEMINLGGCAKGGCRVECELMLV